MASMMAARSTVWAAARAGPGGQVGQGGWPRRALQAATPGERQAASCHGASRASFAFQQPGAARIVLYDEPP
jgi:hypothetical protein